MMNKISILILALLLTGCTRSTTPAPSAEVAAQFVGLAAITQTAAWTPTITPMPTLDPSYLATVNAANAVIAANNAEMSKLALESAQTLATATRQPVSATETQAAINIVKITVSAEETRIAKTQAAYITKTAYAPTARAIERAEKVAPVWDGIRILIGLICAGALLLVVLYIYRVKSWELSEAQKDREIYRENAEMESMNAHPSNRDSAPMYQNLGDGEYTRIPAISEDSKRRIADYVRRHGWNDDMRNGAGVGLSHGQLVTYRAYLERLGVLRQNGNGYDVVKPEYFNNPLPHRESVSNDAESTGSDMLRGDA